MTLTTKFQSDSYLSGGRFPVSHRNVVLKLELDDTFKTNNSSSQEANDLSLLKQTVDLHSYQLYTKSQIRPHR